MATNARIGRAAFDMTQKKYKRTNICLYVVIALLNACPISEQCGPPPGPCGMFPPPPPPMPFLAPPMMAMLPPMFMPPPMPMPLPVPAPAAFAIFFNGNGNGGKTTTTTTQNPMPNMNFGIAIPMPPFGMPPPTIVKFPNLCNNKNDCDSSSGSSDSSESCSDNRRRSKKRSGRNSLRKGGSKKHHNKRPKLVKPVLSYVARNGKVQFETKISNVEAFELLNNRDDRDRDQEKVGRSGDNMAPRSVKILTKSDSNGKNHLVVMESDEEMMLGQVRRSAPRRINNEVNQLSRGRKQIFFNPPDSRKISNMSIAFQIVR